VTPAFADANHHPHLRIAEGIDLEVDPGESVTLTADVSDPDGDGVTVHWWVYDEASTSRGDVTASPAVGTTTTVAVPADGRSGDTIHVIAEAVDDAPRPLKAYARVILTVR